MFVNGANLLYSHKSINQLFTKVNEELEKIGYWFIANKLSLIKNFSTHFFIKKSIKDDLALKLPNLKIANNQTERKKKTVKFLVVMLDENLDWQEHICTVEYKIAKNIR